MSSVVEQGNYLKFTQSDNRASLSKEDTSDPTPLRELLLGTYQKELVEVRLPRLQNIHLQQNRFIADEFIGGSL